MHLHQAEGVFGVGLSTARTWLRARRCGGSGGCHDVGELGHLPWRCRAGKRNKEKEGTRKEGTRLPLTRPGDMHVPGLLQVFSAHHVAADWTGASACLCRGMH